MIASEDPIVATPTRLVRQDAASLTFDAPAPGTIPLRIRWNRWLTVGNGATLVRQGDWVAVQVTGSGRYTVGS